MERVTWLEVLGRHGVAHRIRLGGLPVTIGRGYANDVILDDPHADAAHARIVLREDGALLLEDLGTVNGTALEQRGAAALRGASAVIGPGQVIRIGQTRLRLAASDLPVPPARPLPADAGGMMRALASRRALITLPLAGVAVLLLQSWLGDAQGDAASLASLVLGVIAVFGAWAGGWAIAGRLAIQQSRFAAHHAVAWAFMLVFTVAGIVLGWLDFLTESRLIDGIGEIVLWVVFVWLLDRHLALASLIAPRRRLVVAAVTTAVLAALGVVLDKAGSDFAGSEVAIGATLKPAPAGIVPAKSVDELIEMTNAIREEVDELKE